MIWVWVAFGVVIVCAYVADKILSARIDALELKMGMEDHRLRQRIEELELQNASMQSANTKKTKRTMWDG